MTNGAMRRILEGREVIVVMIQCNIKFTLFMAFYLKVEAYFMFMLQFRGG